ncbi:hypothetical protein RIF29_23274 [Crotalaria pallida]|uniref:Peptidase A1 domain-containing protein n=1 Tax=Crotalaria pallida TaxID=3830 RepID=A0AAN9F7E8_CROPI
MSLPFSKFLLLLLHVFFSCSLFLFPIPTHETETALVAPIFKDKSTNLFTLSVNLKTPLQRTNLYLDLGFSFSWLLCDTYNSSSFSEIPCTQENSLCLNVGFGGLSCGNCVIFSPPKPSCIEQNLVCDSFPENPVQNGLKAIGKGGLAVIDTLALPTTANDGSALGSLVRITNFTFACTSDNSTNVMKGLPKHITGLASLARSNLSIPNQISSALSTPNIVSLCFPSSTKVNGPGLAFFGTTGPYYALSSSNSKIDLSELLVYTPLIVNPVAFGDTVINYRTGTPSSHHFIGLTSIHVNGKPVPVNSTLLAIDQESGLGGTEISTATPYTRLESTIFKAFAELFEKEAASPPFNLKVTSPVRPFNVCYPAGDLTLTPEGPSVPIVDFVLHAKDVVWRIVGANSMVRIQNKKGVDLWCLGFLDGGVNGDAVVNGKNDQKTPIVIGGKQLEDNLIQFDIESNRFGFTSSLLSHSLSCTNLAIHSK